MPWVKLLQMKLNNTNKLPREEKFPAFPNGKNFPSPNQLFQNSDAILLPIQKIRSLVFIFELQKANVCLSLKSLSFPASKMCPNFCVCSSILPKLQECIAVYVIQIIRYYPYLTFRYSWLDILYIHNVFTTSLRNTNSLPSFHFVASLHFMTLHAAPR